MCPNPEKKKAINSHLSSLSYTNKSFFMGLFVTFKPLYTQIYYSCEDFHVFSFLFVLMLHIYNKHLILHQAWHLLDAPKVYFFLKKIFIRQQWMQFIFYGQKSSRFWRFLPQMDRGGGISFILTIVTTTARRDVTKAAFCKEIKASRQTWLTVVGTRTVSASRAKHWNKRTPPHFSDA